MVKVKNLIVLAPLALLAACGGSSEEEAAAEPVAAVKTAVAVFGKSSQSIDVFGVAEPAPGSERAMATQAEGTLVRILAPTGTTVHAGQVVAILNPTHTSQLEAAKARSDAAAAGAALARALRLRKDGLVSDGDVESARAAAQLASATLASTGQRNGTLVLRAPATGTVQNLNAKVGDVIPAGTTVAAIGGAGDLRARFGIDPTSVGKVHVGAPITVSTGTGGTTYQATVAGVDPQVDATTRLASVFVRVAGGNGFALGQPLRASIEVGSAASGVTLPYSALLDDGGKSFVFVVDKDVAHKVAVLPGNSDSDRIVILKGVKPGDRVVTEGGTALEDGMKVTDATSGAAAKPGAGK